jgi:hypothetical protein
MHKINRVFLEINKVTCNKLTNIDGKACNDILEAVNKLALSARLSHSCDTGEINMIPLILYQPSFIYHPLSLSALGLIS